VCGTKNIVISTHSLRRPTGKQTLSNTNPNYHPQKFTDYNRLSCLRIGPVLGLRAGRGWRHDAQTANRLATADETNERLSCFNSCAYATWLNSVEIGRTDLFSENFLSENCLETCNRIAFYCHLDIHYNHMIHTQKLTRSTSCIRTGVKAGMSPLPGGR